MLFEKRSDFQQKYTAYGVVKQIFMQQIAFEGYKKGSVRKWKL